MNDELVGLLSELVGIETVNDPINNVRPTLNAVLKIKELIDNFLNTSSQILESNGFYSIYNIIGSGRPIVLVLAHFDTVPVNLNSWKFNPFKLNVVGRRAYGRGSLDDKGNIVAALLALKNLINKHFDGTLIYAFTGDEEIGGRNGALKIKEYLEKRNLMPNYLINCDGNGLKPIIRRRNAFKMKISTAIEQRKAKGRVFKRRFKVKVNGKLTRHSAYFTPGVDVHPLLTLSEYLRYNENLCIKSISGSWVKTNVIPEYIEVEFIKLSRGGKEYIIDLSLTKLIKALIMISRINIESEYYSEYGVSINPNMYYVKGNKNIIEVDIRVLRKDIPLKFIEQVKYFLEKCGLRDCEVVVSGGSGYLYTSENSKIAQLALKINKELSLSQELCELAGASDSRFFSPLGVQCIDYGPIGGNIHGPNEFVYLNSIEKAAKFYERLLKELFYRQSFGISPLT